MILKRIGPLSAAKIAGVLYAILGLVFGIGFSLFSTLAAVALPNQNTGPLGFLFGAGAFIWMPLFYGVMGFVAALVGATLYNGLARLVGGVRVDLE